MTVRLSISEILNKVSEIKTKSEKIKWLQSYDCIPLRSILRLTYDKENVKFLLPDSPPPWKKNNMEEGTEGLLYKETRRLRIFVKGGGYDDLNQVKRESLFISLLEDLNDDDADLLANHVISQKPIKGLTEKTLVEAFPDIYRSKIG
jgi:hypothetical protein